MVADGFGVQINAVPGYPGCRPAPGWARATELRSERERTPDPGSWLERVEARDPGQRREPEPSLGAKAESGPERSGSPAHGC